MTSFLHRFPTHLQRRMRQFFPLALVFATGVSGIICASCEDELVNIRPSDVVFPDSGVSYSRHVDALFQQSCAASQCHGGSAPAADLNLEAPSYQSLSLHRPRLILSGDGTNSLLVLRLTGEVGARMPLNLPALNENQIRGIKRWVDEGAINN